MATTPLKNARRSGLRGASESSLFYLSLFSLLLREEELRSNDGIIKYCNYITFYTFALRKRGNAASLSLTHGVSMPCSAHGHAMAMSGSS